MSSFNSLPIHLRRYLMTYVVLELPLEVVVDVPCAHVPLKYIEYNMNGKNVHLEPSSQGMWRVSRLNHATLNLKWRSAVQLLVRVHARATESHATLRTCGSDIYDVPVEYKWARYHNDCIRRHIYVMLALIDKQVTVTRSRSLSGKMRDLSRQIIVLLLWINTRA